MLTAFQILGNLWLFVYMVFQILALLGFLISEKNKKIKKYFPVSFVIAVWNEGSRIERCVNSILKQNYKEKIEIIVIGGGTDNTAEICKKLERNGKIEYIEEKKRKGKWFALNKAVKRTKYDLIAFVDGDCVLGKKWLEGAVSKINGIDLVITREMSTTEKTYIGKAISMFQLLSFYAAKNLAKFFGLESFMGYGSIVKKSVFKKIKFKKSFVEDYWFCHDARKGGFKINFADDIIVFHSVPKKLKSLKDEFLRVMYGFNLEFRMKGAFFLKLYSVFIFLFLIGLPFYIYNIFNNDYISYFLSVFSIIIFLIYATICSLKQKTLKYTFYIPHFIFFIIFLGIINFQVNLKILREKRVDWNVFEKI